MGTIYFEPPKRCLWKTEKSASDGILRGVFGVATLSPIVVKGHVEESEKVHKIDPDFLLRPIE